MSTARAILKTLRPHQWVKNVFVLAPVVFAKQLTHPEPTLRAAAAFACFCALSGAVYALNDVVDVDADRAHPTKRNRPIASGALSRSAALALAAILATGGLAGAFLLTWQFGAVAVAYLTINLGYSFGLKHVAWLDVVLIALGFVLRVLGGALAVPVTPSHWLLICTGLLALLLGLGKRAHELVLATEGPRTTRAALEAYRPGHVRLALHLLAAATCVAYVAYTQSPQTVAFFGTRLLLLTAPFCVVGIWRYLRLTLDHSRPESPTDAMLRDRAFLVNLAAWGLTVLAVVYAVR